MLILDSHVTHTKNLAATDMAWEAGVVMVPATANSSRAKGKQPGPG